MDLKYVSNPGKQLIEPVHQCCAFSLTKLSLGSGKAISGKKAIREGDLLTGVLAGVPNFVLQSKDLVEKIKK